MKIAGVVLSGGQSKRMGTDKSQLMIGNKKLLEHSKYLLVNSEISEVYVSGRGGIDDVFKNKGPLSGIHASLCYLKDFEGVIFSPVDMPFLTRQVFNELITAINLKHNQAICFEGNVLPLIIKNNQHVRLLVENQIKMGELSIYGLLKKLDFGVIENNYSKKIFINTNSPNQWQLAKRELLK